MNDTPLSQRLREYWFAGTLGDPSKIPGRIPFWFARDPARDEEMQRLWSNEVAAAAAGRLDRMGETPTGRLALILLLDQLPRNIYRGSPQAFARDGRARYLMRDGMAHLMDLALSPIERCFFYMPLQHSEFLEDQESGVARFNHLVSEVSREERETFQRFARYAQQHLEVIARFGRFPHRNAILGRLSTRDEEAYLAGNVPAFSQGTLSEGSPLPDPLPVSLRQASEG
ncbi:MAG: DUF924 domain-containing protein [Gammaproteobacteria bacterium]|nr:MAG: DUF924 domain-containing protein [Gammaproteobacteria bacterium]